MAHKKQVTLIAVIVDNRLSNRHNDTTLKRFPAAACEMWKTEKEIVYVRVSRAINVSGLKVEN
jgi:hypothetical protein